jgi:hypothetical protein
MQGDAGAAGGCCRHLRSKAFYMGLAFHPSGVETDTSPPCWCFRTQQVLGPDDEEVTPALCTVIRACFEPEGAPPG